MAFKNRLSKLCKKQPLNNLKWYGLPKQTISLQIFLKAVFHKFYLVYSYHDSDHLATLRIKGIPFRASQNFPESKKERNIERKITR